MIKNSTEINKNNRTKQNNGGTHVLPVPSVQPALPFLAPPADHTPRTTRFALSATGSCEALLAAFPVVAVSAGVSLEGWNRTGNLKRSQKPVTHGRYFEKRSLKGLTPGSHSR